MPSAFREIPAPVVTVRRSKLDLFKLDRLQPPDWRNNTQDVWNAPVLFVDPKTGWVWVRLAGGVKPHAESGRAVGVPLEIQAATTAQNKVVPGGEVRAFRCVSLSPYVGYEAIWWGDEDVRVVTRASMDFII